MGFHIQRSLLPRLGAALVLALTLAGCGGGSSSDDPGPSGPQVTRIGAAGGTATGPGGSKAVVPAGALAQDVDIGIQASDDGAPPLPTDTTRIGTVYAFTPHGTTFAQPVSVTVPFDPAQLPAGSSPALYKTNAGRAGWAEVQGAVVDGATMVGSVSGFSNLVVVIPPLIKAEPRYRWWHYNYMGRGSLFRLTTVPNGSDGQVGGVLSELVDLGPHPLDLTLSLLAQSFPGDGRANGYVFAQGNGTTFGSLAEAPFGRLDSADPIGGGSNLEQLQSFRKEADDATLTFTLTTVFIRLDDFLPHSGQFDLEAGATLSVRAYLANDPTKNFYIREGRVSASGDRGDWKTEALTTSASRGALWFNSMFDSSIEPVTYSAAGASCLGESLRLTLSRPQTYAIDLSGVPTGVEFIVHAHVKTYAINEKGGGAIGDCQGSRAIAFLRDPQEVGGPMITYTGLLPTATTSTESPPRDAYEPPASCPGGPVPAAGTLQFSSGFFAINEAEGSAPSILVTRTGGSTGAVSATFATVGGTAVAGTDYQPVLTTVHFGDGDSGTRFVEVPIIPNSLDEPDRTVLLALSEAGGCAALGAPTSAVLTIEDDDLTPVARFTIGGTVTGLAGGSLVIDTSSANPLTITANGGFQFPETFRAGSAYEVVVDAQPQNPRQSCTVSNGAGTLNANVSNVQIACTTLPVSGSLDPGFGSGGTAWFLQPGSQPYNHAIALQPDGKLLFVTGSDRLIRLLPDGKPDPAFGSAGDGVVVVSSGQTISYQVSALAVQPDGRIVVAGTVPSGVEKRPDMLVARYTASGTLDPSFAGGLGITTFDQSGTWSDGVVHLLLQADGSILLAGLTSDPLGSGGSRFAVLKLTAAGAIDPRWGLAGLANVGIDRFSLARSAAHTGDGGVVLAGRVAASGGALADLGLVKFTAAGVPDPSFGTTGNGIVRPLVSGSHEEATDVVVQPDGKIVVLATSLVGTSWLVRYLPNGQIDTSFGVNGEAQIATRMTGWALALQADGSLWVAGEASGNHGLVRVTAAGQPDGAFNSGATLALDFFGGFDTAGALLQQPDGLVVVAGRAANGSISSGLGVVRVVP